MGELNTSIFLAINQMSGQSAFFDKIIVIFGDYLAYILVAAFLGLFLYKSISRFDKIALFVTAAAGAILGRGVLVEIIRFFYHHPRPVVALPQIQPLIFESSYSFPSGHATLFFMLSAVIYHYNKKIGVIFFILSAFMGLARIAAGVHYPLDILGGAILGILIAGVCIFLTRKYFKYINFV